VQDAIHGRYEHGFIKADGRISVKAYRRPKNCIAPRPANATAPKPFQNLWQRCIVKRPTIFCAGEILVLMKWLAGF
jgi:hypothetical protein